MSGSLNVGGVSTFSNYITAPYYLVTSNIPSSTASTGYLDYSGGGTRLFSVGTSGATKGTFRFIAKGADDSSIEPMAITNAGVVTKPHQVSFKAYISASNPTLSRNAYQTVPYTGEEYDTQGNFSTSTYKFTAPVAGKYLFAVNLNLYGMDDAARLNVVLYINSSQTRFLYAFANLPTGNTGDTNVSGTDILNLASGDTVEVRVFTDGTGTFVMSNGLTYNSFSGHLLG
jgi:hypothetical protein